MKALPDFMSGVTAFFYNVTQDEKKRLTRYLVAYPLAFNSFNYEKLQFPRLWLVKKKTPIFH